jgi:hypothetical protein
MKSMLAAGVAVLLWSAAAFAADPVGSYKVEGANPGGGAKYRGTVTVEKTGQTYRSFGRSAARAISAPASATRISSPSRTAPATLRGLPYTAPTAATGPVSGLMPAATTWAPRSGSGNKDNAWTWRRRGTIAVVPAAFAGDATRVPELWLIPPGSKPLPIGLLNGDKPVVIAIPAGLVAQTASGATLAVSLEPPGGSPTGVPTVPVIGAGKLTAL